MALSIRNPKAEELAREVAAESGENLTQAIISALEERLQRLKGRRTSPSSCHFQEPTTVYQGCGWLRK